MDDVVVEIDLLLLPVRTGQVGHDAAAEAAVDEEACLQRLAQALDADFLAEHGHAHDHHEVAV